MTSPTPTTAATTGRSKKMKKRKQSHLFMATEVIAHHSDPCSRHCRLRPVLLALLPAWTNPWLITCQDIEAYTSMPLQAICLVRADHPHRLQDLGHSQTLHLPTQDDRKSKSSQLQLISTKKNYFLARARERERETTHTHTRSHTHTLTHAHAHTHTRAHTHTHTRIHTHTHTHTRTRAHMRTRSYAHAGTRTHAHTRTCAHAHTRVHAYTHTHTHTHSHAHARTRSRFARQAHML